MQNLVNEQVRKTNDQRMTNKTTSDVINNKGDSESNMDIDLIIDMAGQTKQNLRKKSKHRQKSEGE